MTDDGGLSAQAEMGVMIEAPPPPNQPPVARISGPARATVGERLSFSAADSVDADGSITAYVWDFGDGTSDTGADVRKTYNQPGSYQVVVTVTDDGGLSAQAEMGVAIEAAAPPPNQPPVAKISGPAAGQVGGTLHFSGKKSVDKDGEIVKYAWNFGDGTKGSGQEVDHVYESPGTYQVVLTVTDNAGERARAKKNVQIQAAAPENAPPGAVIAGPTQAQIGVLLTFDGSASSDPDGTIVEYAWDFGDGTGWDGVTVRKVYSQTGSYQVTLTVTDDHGASNTAAQVLTVEPLAPGNVPPVAVIGGPASGQTDEPVRFSAADSSDSDGGIVGYLWEFGDGTTSSEVDVRKAYTAPGTYTLVLTVTDDGGLCGQAVQSITIEPPGAEPDSESDRERAD